MTTLDSWVLVLCLAWVVYVGRIAQVLVRAHYDRAARRDRIEREAHYAWIQAMRQTGGAR